MDMKTKTTEQLIKEIEDLQQKLLEFKKLHEQQTTELKSLGKVLREDEIYFRKLSLHVPGMIYQFMRRADNTYCVPFTTDTIQDIFGCTPDDVREDFSPIAKVIIPEDLNKVVTSIEHSASTLTTWECEYRVQIGEKPVRWMLGNSSPEPLEDGSIMWYGFNTDITERKKIEASLRESEQKFRTIFEESPIGIELYDAMGYLVSSNRASRELFGISDNSA